MWLRRLAVSRRGVVSRKRGRYLSEKTQDAVELPKKVRNMSRFQALEEHVSQMSQLLTSAESVGNAALLQKLESQEAELEELRKRLKTLSKAVLSTILRYFSH